MSGKIQTTSRRTADLKLRFRRGWLALHRWIGLSVGLLLVVIGLTGSLLVFDHAIDEWLNPQLLLSQAEGETRPIESIIVAAEAAFPGDVRAGAVSTPRVDGGVWTVWFTTGAPESPKFVAVYVDACSGQVTGQRVWGEYLMTWVYRLHYQLLAGGTGGTLVGLIGVLLLVSIVSGIYLWWPIWRNSWRAAFAIRGGRRFNFDLHKTSGILSAIFLAVITFTGITMEFPHLFQAVLSQIGETTASPTHLQSGQPVPSRGISADRAVEIASRLFPKAKFDHLHPPEGESGVYEVAFRQDDEVQESFGRTQVYVDRFSGEILAVRTPDDFTAADTFLAWQFPLHNGEAFGLLGRWAVFLSGLMPAVLYVTGLLIWWRRGSSRRQRRRQSASSPAQLSSDRQLPSGAV